MSDRDDAGVHTLPFDVEYGGLEFTITPTAVETDRGVVLIDVGPDGAVDALRTHLTAIGYDLADVWLVVLTHHDGDHAGGLDELLDHTDAVVAAHREEAPYVTGDREPIKGDGDRYPPVAVDLELTDGVRVPTLAGPMDVVETPGHAPGHISLHFPAGGLLIAGDALVADGAASLSGPNPEFTPDMNRALESVAGLADLEIEHVVCHHGGYVQADSDRLREIVDSSC
ncbi:MBL fold metallo-hydrolase [Natrarchaeobaculum sulfurireducens]|uniref:Beta-lactamase-like n=1 Tax=Natrarchaeobaculum sulfurireducens TaxID=2044521 RepID=A0A346PT28_9EURY|nr:MBL fold metallo-hydrolase [Natrarchaeobaculum sulfurireducens]AXR77362.1 Metal-dependent hydrolase of the beta-lactamase superfamily II [Natrarchaeobaculum sulfurireducens]AXR82673.1 Beta-lactamase-like [Natrarchaeobaculum sulfurireducens]